MISVAGRVIHSSIFFLSKKRDDRYTKIWEFLCPTVLVYTYWFSHICILIQSRSENQLVKETRLPQHQQQYRKTNENNHIIESIEGSRTNTLCKFKAFSIVENDRREWISRENIKNKTNNNLSAFLYTFWWGIKSGGLNSLFLFAFN